MEPPHVAPGHRTFIGTVVFVDIVDYSTRLVVQQVDLKTRLNAMISRALEHVAAPDRMTLDTGDGAALCFLGDPEDALFVASSLRAAAVGADPDLALRIGINTGPLRVVRDVNNQPNIIGDGINDAQRVMSFAAPNQILVSRSFYEIVSRLSQEYARLFQYVGLHRDKHVREHEVYAVTGGAGKAVAPPDPGGGGGGGAPAGIVAAEAAPRAGGTGRFEATVLAQLEGALAERIGPLARVLVRRAAAGAPDLRALCQALVSAVPEPDRSRLAERLGDLCGAFAGPGGAPETAGASPEAKPGRSAGAPLSPEVLAGAGERLAIYLGPVAKVLVHRAAQHATGARDLYQRLAQHIDDPQARQRFVAATEELSEP